MLVICENCGIEFDKRPHDVKRTRRNYCCAKCKTDASRKYNEIIIKEDHAEIIINNNKYGRIITLIDIEDINKIKEITWGVHFDPTIKGFYVRGRLRGGKRKYTPLHRLIMDCPRELQIDHINHDTLDNRRINLRIVTACENRQNLSGAHTRNKLGIRNVFKFRDGYMIKIDREGKTIKKYCRADKYTLEEVKSLSEKMRKEYMPFATC